MSTSFNFKPYCACRFRTVQFVVLVACFPAKGNRGGGGGGGGRGRGVGSAEIGLVFVARFIKPLT